MGAALTAFERLARGLVVDEETGCWNYTHRNRGKGYGEMYFEGRLQGTHCIAWQLVHGPIPKGHEICHRCDNPPCCNPEHLFSGTRSENFRDSVKKGRWHGYQPKTHCKLGHELSEDNIYWDGRGRRNCQLCRWLRPWLEKDGFKLSDFHGAEAEFFAEQGPVKPRTFQL